MGLGHRGRTGLRAGREVRGPNQARQSAEIRDDNETSIFRKGEAAPGVRVEDTP